MDTSAPLARRAWTASIDPVLAATCKSVWPSWPWVFTGSAPVSMASTAPPGCPASRFSRASSSGPSAQDADWKQRVLAASRLVRAYSFIAGSPDAGSCGNPNGVSFASSIAGKYPVPDNEGRMSVQTCMSDANCSADLSYTVAALRRAGDGNVSCKLSVQAASLYQSYTEYSVYIMRGGGSARVSAAERRCRSWHFPMR